MNHPPSPELQAANALLTYGQQILQAHRDQVGEGRARIVVTMLSGKAVSGTVLQCREGIWMCGSGNKLIPFNALAAATIELNWDA